MQHTLVCRNSDCTRRIDDPVQITTGHFTLADSDDAMRIQTTDMTAGDSGIDRVDLTAGHQFCLFDGMLDRLHGRFDINHHAFLQSV